MKIIALIRPKVAENSPPHAQEQNLSELRIVFDSSDVIAHHRIIDEWEFLDNGTKKSLSADYALFVANHSYGRNAINATPSIAFV